MEPVKYVLKEPITFGTETITELTFRKPTAKDLRGVDLTKPTIDLSLLMAERLSGQFTKVIDALGLEDAFAIAEIMADFLPLGPMTGSSASQ